VFSFAATVTVATAIVATTVHKRCANRARERRQNVIKTVLSDAASMPRANVTTKSVNVAAGTILKRK
jgi:Na+-translocating ferredoxin:NAD+ oxidoreductase RnfG subunit